MLSILQRFYFYVYLLMCEDICVDTVLVESRNTTGALECELEQL